MIQRMDLVLPPGDVKYLNASHAGWQITREGTASWLLLPDYEMPDGYSHSATTLALRLEPAYPDTQIDMVFVCPPLSRADEKLIGATGGRKVINGVSFQQWSRHRSPANPWRAGVDDIEAHMLLVKHWFEREFAK